MKTLLVSTSAYYGKQFYRQVMYWAREVLLMSPHGNRRRHSPLQDSAQQVYPAGSSVRRGWCSEIAGPPELQHTAKCSGFPGVNRLWSQFVEKQHGCLPRENPQLQLPVTWGLAESLKG